MNIGSTSGIYRWFMRSFHYDEWLRSLQADTAAKLYALGMITREERDDVLKQCSVAESNAAHIMEMELRFEVSGLSEFADALGFVSERLCALKAPSTERKL